MEPVKGASGQQPKNFYTAVHPIAIYDPSSNLTYVLDSAAGFFWSYNYARNKYKYPGRYAQVPSNSTAVLDPKRKTIFSFGNNTTGPGNATKSKGAPNIYALSLSGVHNLTNLTRRSRGCLNLAGAYYRIVGWPTFWDTVYIFNPTTDACTSQTFAVGPTDSSLP